MDSETPLPLRESLNPSAVLEFSKMYKFIVKFVIFFIVGVKTKNDQINDQFLCGHFQSRYPVTKFGHLSWLFLVGFYPVTKSDHLSWSFLVSSLKFINFGHSSLKKTMVTKIFGLLVTNLSFSTSALTTHVLLGSITNVYLEV